MPLTRLPAPVIGRLRGASTNSLSLPGVVPASASSITESPASNRDYYFPFLVATPSVLDQASAEITSAASASRVFRLGLYAADTNWQPLGAPIFDSGALAADSTGVKTYTPSTAIPLGPGRYLGAYVGDGIPTLRALDGGIPGGLMATTWGVSLSARNLDVSRTYAAFPTPGTAWTTLDTGTSAGLRYFMAMRLSTV